MIVYTDKDIYNYNFIVGHSEESIMKKVLLFALIIFTLFSCSKKEDTPIQGTINDPMLDKIKELGCHVKNPGTICEIRLLKDSINNFIYLYGARYIDNNKEYSRAWFSKYYLSNGNLIWDSTYVDPCYYISENEQTITCDTRITIPQFLSNGNIVCGYILGEGFNEARVGIINQQTGNLSKLIKFGNHETFADILKFNDLFFVVGVTGGITGYREYSNDGDEFLYDSPIVLAPNKNSIILTPSTFINIDQSITKKNIFGQTLWNTKLIPPPLSTISVKDTILTISYLSSSATKDTIRMRISTNTGLVIHN